MRRHFTSIGLSSARASQAGGSRAMLAAAIAASLLIPFSGGAASVASAAPSLPSASQVRAAESTDGLIHMALIPGESEARYIISLSTLGQAPKPAVCATRAVTGEIVLTPEGAVVTELSKIVLDQRTLQCQSPLSDSRAKTLLQVDQHPLAEFNVHSTPGLGMPLPAGETAFQLVGDQTVRGQTRPTTYDTNATLTPDSLVGLARTTFKMTTFGITPPNLGIVKAMDDMVAEVDIKATVGTPAAGAALPAPAADPATEPAADPAADPAAGETETGEGEVPAEAMP